MDPSAIPVFMAGPFPVVYSSRMDPVGVELELDIAILIGGLPTMLAATSFPLDETWDRIRMALASGDAKLGVAGIPHERDAVDGSPAVYPAAYVGLECANGERLVLAHIRGPDSGGDAESFARGVMGAILRGRAPAELGVAIED